MTFDRVRSEAISEWEALQRSEKPRLLVGTGTCGRSAGALTVLEAIKVELAKRNVDAIIMEVGCLGLCYIEPLVEIVMPGRPGICYGAVTPEIAMQLIEDYIVKDDPRPDLALGTLGEGAVEGIPNLFDLPTLRPQMRITLRNCGRIDPENINHYIASGGFSGLAKALQMTPEQVIEEVKRSGIRGRGGAGFPTGRKWESCRNSPGTEKYVICNADEGDPGAFMDRSILEADPQSVIEGMTISAYAIGTPNGYIYVRAEYPLAVRRFRIALRQAEERGFLGRDILGSGFNFTIQVREGAGAYVCGESTALMKSVEGKRGMPRPTPPRSVEAGLWGKPTSLNNVKTFATVPEIINRGADWYASIGTEGSKGTMVFALTGKIAKSGLVEVPMGTTLREIIYDIGGGLVDGKRFKAVQTGGPSGGCLPAELLSLPVDYESLTEAGSIMGSGGMIVADEETCMVDVAKFFLAFTEAESCGKCVPCRVGAKQMLDILDRISRGRGELGDIELLQQLSETIRDGSLCGLGTSAPNPVLTTVRYFRDEYEAHIKRKRCPAVVCKEIVIAPCLHSCPAGIDVPRYVRAIGDGRFSEALAVIREKVPFPGVLGRICPHPCEAKCRRGELEGPLAIRALKRFVSERDDGLWRQRVKVAPKTEKRVAIVGSGPAGLTAAYYLAKLGHSVTIFEALPEAGGLMRFGIPEYQLPREVLQREIDDILSLGIELKLNSAVNRLDELFAEGYHAIFVAIGLQEGRKLSIPGTELGGVFDGLSLLRNVKLGEKVELGRKVLILGGGGAACDVARVARRLGVPEIHMACLESREAMPAHPWELREAEEEGAIIHPSRTFSKILGDKGHVTGVECLTVKWMMFDEEGQLQLEAVEGSEHVLEADTVIFATGQGLDRALIVDNGLNVSKRGTITVDSESLETDQPGVFAGGDAVTGPASVIEAIATGRQAASSIDNYLGGDGKIDEELAPPEGEVTTAEVEEGERYRAEMPCLALGDRLGGFAEVELGLDEEMAVREARRCLRCDLEEG